MKSFVSFFLHKVLLEQSNQEDEVGMTCSTHGRNEKFIQNFCQKTQGEEIIWET